VTTVSWEIFMVALMETAAWRPVIGREGRYCTGEPGVGQ